MKSKTKKLFSLLFAVIISLSLLSVPAYADNPTGNASSVNQTVSSTSDSGKWVKSGKKWWYRHSDGSYPRSKWELIDNSWYHFDGSGWMQTGWQKIGKKWYYLNKSGAMAIGWKKVSGKWYYLNGSGVMQTGWQQVDGTWYYLNKSGVMQTGWEKIGGKWYYLKGSGAMVTGWAKVGGKWYYLKSSGAMATGWQQVDGTWYYLNKSGVMQTGWEKIKGKWYYFYGSGAMAADTKIGKNYVDPNGVWIEVGAGESVYKIDYGNGKYGLVVGSFKSSMANDIFNQLNTYRASKGLPALKKASAGLQDAANLRAAELPAEFSHYRPNGQICFSVYDMSDAENIARGYSSAKAVMTAWKNSTGHNANMLNTFSTSVGIGVFKAHNGSYYYVQLFSVD